MSSIPAQPKQAPGALELIEEAVHLLRTAPASTLADYYVGTLPFVLGLLYFWGDASRSAFADQHLAGGALGLALLFLWMKFSQAVFARKIRALMTGDSLVPLTAGQTGRLFITQSALQPSGLFVVPLASVPVLPLGWAYAFYQNLTALGETERGSLRGTMSKSARLAALWPKQNLLLLTILSGFGCAVFLNWAMVCLTLPSLVKMLLGIETMFSRSVLSLLNTTFFAAMAGLTYLCVDPIVKASYVLRCFYGQSIHSGEDLKAGLRQCELAARAATLCFCLFLGVASARGQGLPASTHPAEDTSSGLTVGRAASTSAARAPAIAPPRLDQAIERVLQQRKYAWRMPRERVDERDAGRSGIIARFFERVGNLLRRGLRAVLKWIGDLLQKLFRRFPINRSPGASGYGWIMTLEILLCVLVLAVVVALGWLLYRTWLGRRHARRAPVSSLPVQLAPDLSDENLGADQLAEGGWIKLARELMERGEWRLALRAFYLASLAHLAEHNLISLAKFKSNRDYERELQRRAHALPELLALFGENVAAFDRTWYGRHGIDGDAVRQFAANVEKISAAG